MTVLALRSNVTGQIWNIWDCPLMNIMGNQGGISPPSSVTDCGLGLKLIMTRRFFSRSSGSPPPPPCRLKASEKTAHMNIADKVLGSRDESYAEHMCCLFVGKLFSHKLSSSTIESVLFPVWISCIKNNCYYYNCPMANSRN